jgi:hypothetical protein
VPAKNRPLSADEIRTTKATYNDLGEKARDHGFGMDMTTINKSIFEFAPE